MKNIENLPSINDARKRDKEVSIVVDYKIDEKYKGLGNNKKYFIKTHGCQANQRDSETLAGILDSLGFIMADTQEDADLIIINTCAVRQNAEEKVYGEIGALKRLKREKDLKIGICGCMAQEENTIKTILEKYRQVDLIFGTHNLVALPKLLYDVYTSDTRSIEVFSKQGEIYENVPVTRFMNHKAWVNIMYGCNKFCSYCIVPYTRGKERSRRKEDVVKEVELLVKQGYKEVCLLGQNVDSYGKDLHLGYEFGDLLNEVAKTGIPRIRFMTSHPLDFSDKTIEAMKNNENIMPYLHLPVQSGNTEILQKMNRKYTLEEYKVLFDKLKKNLPHYAYTTDIIVGFPNETEEQFEDTLKLVDYCKFDNAFTFVYSPRVGTPAANMEDNVPLKEKEERLQRLNTLVGKYANENNQKYLGKVLEVLVDGSSKRNKEIYSGYSKENKLVNFKAKDVSIGDIVKVKITDVKSFSLDGEELK